MGSGTGSTPRSRTVWRPPLSPPAGVALPSALGDPCAGAPGSLRHLSQGDDPLEPPGPGCCLATPAARCRDPARPAAPVLLLVRCAAVAPSRQEGGEEGDVRRAWTGARCRCRTSATGCRRGSRPRTRRTRSPGRWPAATRARRGSRARRSPRRRGARRRRRPSAARAGVQRERDAADVPPVAARDQRQQRDRGVLGGVRRAGQSTPSRGQRGPLRAGRSSTTRPWSAACGAAGPAAPRRSPARCPGAAARTTSPACVTRTSPKWTLASPQAARCSSPDHLDLGQLPRRGRVAGLGRVHQRHLVRQVEPSHQVGLRLVQVDRAGVRQHVRRRLVHGAEQPAGRGLHDLHRRARRSRAGRAGQRAAAAGQVPARRRGGAAARARTARRRRRRPRRPNRPRSAAVSGSSAAAAHRCGASTYGLSGSSTVASTGRPNTASG